MDGTGTIRSIPGTWVLHKGEVHQVVSSTGGNSIIRRAVNQSVQSVPSTELRLLNPYRLQMNRLKPLDEYPQKSQEEARRRLKEICALLDQGCPPDLVARSAKQLEMSILTLGRLIDRFVCSGGRAAVLVPNVFRFGTKNHRISEDAERVIEEVIRVYYLSRQRTPHQAVIETAQRKCRELGLQKIPSDWAIKQRLLGIPRDEALLHREGRKAVREKYTGQPKRAPDGGFPLGMVQMDHTQMDVFIIQPDGSKVRPYITVAVDVYSRMVLGFYLCFHSPDAKSSAVTLFRTMSDKTPWLRSHGITSSWPCSGVPKLLHTDNAMDFMGTGMEARALDFDFVLEQRPIGKAEWGAFIERLMGRLAYQASLLPGTSFGSVVKKRDYDSEAMATLTFNDLERALLHFFVDIYHCSPHDGLDGRRPNFVWQSYFPAETQGMLPPTLAASPDLLYSLLPFFERTIQQSGVRWEGDEYYDPRITKYIGRKNPRSENGLYRFHFDPDHVRTIFFRDPSSGEWWEIGPRDVAVPDMTEWERKGFRDLDRAEAKATIDQVSIDRGNAAIEKIVNSANQRSRADRRRENELIKAARTVVNREPPARNSKPAEQLPIAQPGRSLPVVVPMVDSAIWDEIPVFNRRRSD